ncbi:dihydrofolate reductase [Pelomyxa schiedti]|nr:dihydrofolate reductase [Pelomyxa schiedti]
MDISSPICITVPTPRATYNRYFRILSAGVLRFLFTIRILMATVMNGSGAPDTVVKEVLALRQNLHVPNYTCIAAVDLNDGIGYNNQLPWHIPHELRFFSLLTSYTMNIGSHNAVIMGRKTWCAINQKPLANRVCVVLSRDVTWQATGASVAPSLDKALSQLAGGSRHPTVESIFVIGGAEVFKEALQDPRCTMLHITRVGASHLCDTFFPPLPPNAFLSLSRISLAPARDPDGRPVPLVVETLLRANDTGF